MLFIPHRRAHPHCQTGEDLIQQAFSTESLRPSSSHLAMERVLCSSASPVDPIPLSSATPRLFPVYDRRRCNERLTRRRSAVGIVIDTHACHGASSSMHGMAVRTILEIDSRQMALSARDGQSADARRRYSETSVADMDGAAMRIAADLRDARKDQHYDED
ncbi:hypothetical protein G7046_g10091 [Stylonectria norvegica]|nr:hypothetical protein G7046_g10091 [Stylonectria norvegica]